MVTGSMSYVATRPCGCVTLVAVDVPHVMKTAAAEFAKAMRLGDTVNHITSEQLRQTPWKCKEHQAEADREKAQGNLFEKPKEREQEQKRRERRIGRLQERIEYHQKKIVGLEVEMEEEIAPEGSSR